MRKTPKNSSNAKINRKKNTRGLGGLGLGFASADRRDTLKSPDSPQKLKALPTFLQVPKERKNKSPETQKTKPLLSRKGASPLQNLGIFIVSQSFPAQNLAAQRHKKRENARALPKFEYAKESLNSPPARREQDGD